MAFHVEDTLPGDTEPYNEINNRMNQDWAAAYILITCIPVLFLCCAVYANVRDGRARRRNEEARHKFEADNYHGWFFPWRRQQRQQQSPGAGAASGGGSSSSSANWQQGAGDHEMAQFERVPTYGGRGGGAPRTEPDLEKGSGSGCGSRGATATGTTVAEKAEKVVKKNNTPWWERP